MFKGLTSYTGISKHDFKLCVGEALKNEFNTYKIDDTGNKIFRIRGSEKIMYSSEQEWKHLPL